MTDDMLCIKCHGRGLDEHDHLCPRCHGTGTEPERVDADDEIDIINEEMLSLINDLGLNELV